MIPIFVIRPQPGCEATVTALRERGCAADGYPLFVVRALAWEAPDPESIDALLIGSANAVRHGGAALPAFSGKPVYAVGEATAAAVQAEGLTVARIGHGGLQNALDLLAPEHRVLLRIAGHHRTPLTPPEGVTIHERIAYTSEAQPMPAELSARLTSPAVVLLHSAEAARHFASSCSARGIDRSRLWLAAIGPRVAQAAGHGWAALQSAETPDENALLVLAQQMCQEAARAQETQPKDVMQETPNDTAPLPALPQPRRKSGRAMLWVAVLAFLFGGALVGWASWNGYFDRLHQLLPTDDPPTTAPEPSAPTDTIGATNPNPDDSAATGSGEPAAMEALSTVEARLALIESRLAGVDVQASTASGNAARAENLLIAFAARRMVTRGQPLGYLADQLRLRFGDAKPRAVETVIRFGEDPVTLDQLSARLDALGPELAGTAEKQGFWHRASRELGDIFTLRRERSTLNTPEARIGRIQIMLKADRISDAVEGVERLPGADGARRWIADARRYDAAHKALDLIETAAMLEPRRLHDAEGKPIDQPSPIAAPPPEAAPAPPTR